MDRIVVEGGRQLKGNVRIGGSKNAILPIMAASLLTDETSVIEGVPHLKDVETMTRILRSLGVKVEFHNHTLTIEPAGYKGYEAPYKLVSTMRASICVLGPLLAKHKRAKVSMPGGCVIGARPIDLHLKGIRALGAKIKIDQGYIVVDGRHLKGNGVYLGGSFGSSVLATANVLMLAVRTPGRTVIDNAACEPEIKDLCEFLVKMGANITGLGSHKLIIEGRADLRGARHKIIPDRIETGTYMVAAVLTKGDIVIENVIFEHLGAVVDGLKEMGAKITKVGEDAIRVMGSRRLRPVDITTLPYPGFPTDMQAQLMALLCVTPGISIVTEKIYPDRFIHVSELARMGAEIKLEGPSAIVKGVSRLIGAPVMASDLRASAALVLAGLVAKGRTNISRIYHLDRGYEQIEEKLSGLGAGIWREKE